MKTLVLAEGLGKKYTLRHQIGGKYPTLRDAIVQRIKRLNPLYVCAERDANREEFWALQDVSLQVKEGDRVGIIGRNGAGKSTLLKILSRITEPSLGTVRIRGRVASLLEVGTGFHPELTGRENIFLNGSILGMSHIEIKRRFDEIVAFAEVEKFIDTPVKRYSSGMYVRLAFSVAAHLEPDVLIVDEVLAVGDIQFQRKCMGKLEEASTMQGRTVLFVSHNMSAIQSLCTTSLFLKAGRVQEIGETDLIVKAYLADVSASVLDDVSKRTDRTGKGKIRINRLDLSGQGTIASFAIGDDITVNLDVDNSYNREVAVRFSVSIRTGNDVGLIVCDSLMKGEVYKLPATVPCHVTCRISAPPLSYGEYFVNVAIFNGDEAEDWIASAAKFSIESGVFQDHFISLPFPVLTQFQWTTHK